MHRIHISLDALVEHAPRHYRQKVFWESYSSSLIFFNFFFSVSFFCKSLSTNVTHASLSSVHGAQFFSFAPSQVFKAFMRGYLSKWHLFYCLLSDSFCPLVYEEVLSSHG
jgi:hypothetical protein